MSNNNNQGRVKIGFSNAINSNKKIDFSSVRIDRSISKSYQNNDQKSNNQNNTTAFSATNQFRKPVFSYQQNNQTSTKDNINSGFVNANSKEDNRMQFRKPTFSYQKVENKQFNSVVKNVNKDFSNEKRQSGNYFNNGSNEKTNTFNQNYRYNNNTFSENRNNSFSGIKNNGFKKPSKNFFVKKNNQVKVKINADKQKTNDRQQSYKKTANTGGNVDKYSINSMLQGLSNNLELDTEIDDVLGNVINVKLATINSSNSFQHERKVRVSTNENKKVNFNIPIIREIKIFNDKISISNLANQMSVSVKELVNILEKNGIKIDCDRNDIDDYIIDGDTAQIVAENYGHKITRLADDDAEKDFIKNISNGRKDLRKRDPIVAIMGHVDHGKTTLLDTIRKTSVASGEAGGITQHIGAYRTKVGDRYITFLDTPGHAAFTQMRMRGAKVTDIAIIVVAADDGIMPQTIEAINHAKIAGCPIIIAINKIDKPEANIERTKQMLLQYEVIPEDLGGDVMVVPISAKDGKNIDKLLETILLQADILELKAYYDGGVDGVVIESKLDKKKGALTTIIVKNGILKQGDFLIAGEQYGKIKGMFNENGQMLKTAEPSVPVEILGLNSTPDAGEICYAVKIEKEAKEMIAYREKIIKQKQQNSKSGPSYDELMASISGENVVKSVNFIIKADTKGSLEAIVNVLEKIESDEIKLKIVHKGVGSVNENDLLLAESCNGYIITFNTQKCDKKLIEEAENKGVEIKDYKVIYELFDDAKDILSGKLKPVVKKNILGHCEVKAIFEISKVGKIAGCLVKDGIVSRGANVAVIRDGENIIETKCESLKHGKENVKDIQSGQECGIGIENIDAIKIGDILEFFTTKEEKKTI